MSQDWRKNIAIMGDATSEHATMVESLKRVCRKNNQGNMIKIGLTLIAFPFPIVIDDVLGWSFLAAGLIQRRIKNSALYVEDPSETLVHMVKELQETRQQIC